jgi:hypothetical protein
MAGTAAYSSSLIHEADPDNEKVLSVIWKSGLRSWKKRFNRFQTKVRNGAYPAHLESLWVLTGLVTALHLAGYKVPLNLLDKLIDVIPR